MQLLLLLAVVLSVLHAHPLQREWWQWKVQYGRRYGSVVEERTKRNAWMQNYDYIRKHSNRTVGYQLLLNQFADMVSIKLSIFYMASITLE